MLFTYDRARHYAENALWEIQHTNHFEVVIPEYYRMILKYDKDSVSTSNKVKNGLLTAEGITNGQNLKLAVRSISMPELNMEVDEIKQNNISTKIPRNPTCGDATITFYDAIGVNVEKIIMDWYENIFNPRTQSFGYTKNFKADMYVLQYSSDNTYMRVWKLKNVFPKSISIPDFSYEDKSLKTITVNFAVEYAYPLTREEYIALMASSVTSAGAIGVAGMIAQ